MTKSYFTLLGRQKGTSRWSIEFGDYQRQTVVDEQADYRRGYDGQHFEMKIIKTNDDQRSILNAVADLNKDQKDEVLASLLRRQVFTTPPILAVVK